MSQLKSNWRLLTNVACPLHNNQQSKEHQQQPHAPLPISKTGLKELLPPMPSSFTRHGSPFQKQDRALTLNTVIRHQQRKHPGETHHRRQNTRTKQATEVFYIREKERPCVACLRRQSFGCSVVSFGRSLWSFAFALIVRVRSCRCGGWRWVVGRSEPKEREFSLF